MVFPLSCEWFAKVGNFLGPNETTHEINSSERANFSLSGGAKQNSVGSIVFELFLHTMEPFTELDNFECAYLGLFQKGPSASGEHQTPVGKLL